MKTLLLPCPMCGGTAAIRNEKQHRETSQYWSSVDDLTWQKASVTCRACHLQISRSARNLDYNSQNETLATARKLVAEAWNQRTSPLPTAVRALPWIDVRDQ